MAKTPLLQIHVTATAGRDMTAILKWSTKEFGLAASLRYDALLEQAINDIREDPERPGSKERSEVMIAGARIYHMEFSRMRVTGKRVKEPRHFLLYRLLKGRLELGRVIHDSCDLALHLPKSYRLE